MPSWLRRHLAALRLLLVATVTLGIGYPLLVTAVAQLPGLRGAANGSLLRRQGRIVGSALIGQSFAGDPAFFQSRPSASNYNALASGGSNLGPESIAGPGNLLAKVCARSYAIGLADGVDGRRPYCTARGQAAVLAVVRADGHIVAVYTADQDCPTVPFVRFFAGHAVRCSPPGATYAYGQLVAIRGPARAAGNSVPPEAVTGSGSGLDPDIPPAYAFLQVARVARAAHLPVAAVRRLVEEFVQHRELGFLGQPVVNVLELNLALVRLRAHER